MTSATPPVLSSSRDSQVVRLQGGHAVTDSLSIAREFGRRHDNVLQALDRLIAQGVIGLLEFKESFYNNEQNKHQRMVELTERGALIAMPFIGGRRSREGQVRLVDAFIEIRAEATKTQFDAWNESRHKASLGFRMMSDALQETRAGDGKSTRAHHFANEARLVNWILFGHFNAIDRNKLTSGELEMLEAVEGRNAIWIARGLGYKERKVGLLAFVEDLVAKRQKKILK